MDAMFSAPNGVRLAHQFHFMSSQDRIFYTSGYRNYPDGRQEKVAAIIAVGTHLFNSSRTTDASFQAFGAVLPAYVAPLSLRAAAAG